ncbi:MAG: hypothetical protein AAF639_31440 [Chloroflexota bacterium]
MSNKEESSGASTTQSDEKTTIPRHPIDPILKEILVEEVASKYDVGLETEIEVSRLPRTVDVLLTIKKTRERQRVAAETPFFYVKKQNQIEFKGKKDRLRPKDYHRIYARKHLLLSEKDVKAKEMTVTILCAGKPRATITYAAELGSPFASVGDGVYLQKGVPTVYLIVINQLLIVPKNYFLLLFASDKREFRKALTQMTREELQTYVRYAYAVRPHMTREVLSMAGLFSRLSQEDLQFVADDIGEDVVLLLPPEKRMAGLSLEERVAEFAPQEVISNYAPEERVAGLAPEERVAGLAPEERVAGLAPEERVAGLAPQDRLAGLAPQDLLESLSPDFIETLLKHQSAVNAQQAGVEKVAGHEGEPVGTPVEMQHVEGNQREAVTLDEIGASVARAESMDVEAAAVEVTVEDDEGDAENGRVI